MTDHVGCTTGANPFWVLSILDAEFYVFGAVTVYENLCKEKTNYITVNEKGFRVKAIYDKGSWVGNVCDQDVTSWQRKYGDFSSYSYLYIHIWRKIYARDVAVKFLNGIYIYI